MTSIFGAKYFGFIASAYGITFVTLLALCLWILLTARARKKTLARLEADGLKRGSKAQ